jgi:hypothetical protein
VFLKIAPTIRLAGERDAGRAASKASRAPFNSRAARLDRIGPSFCCHTSGTRRCINRPTPLPTLASKTPPTSRRTIFPGAASEEVCSRHFSVPRTAARTCPSRTPPAEGGWTCGNYAAAPGADITDGTSITFLVHEVRAGVNAMDRRGTWAIGLSRGQHGQRWADQHRHSQQHGGRVRRDRGS